MAGAARRYAEKDNFDRVKQTLEGVQSGVQKALEQLDIFRAADSKAGPFFLAVYDDVEHPGVEFNILATPLTEAYEEKFRALKHNDPRILSEEDWKRLDEQVGLVKIYAEFETLLAERTVK